MNENRPPYVTFKKRSVEDRNASLDAGRPVMRDVDMICITPHGSNGLSEVEFEYAEWLRRNRRYFDQDIRDGDSPTPMQNARFPAEWADKIQRQYELWKKGHALDIEGTPLASWPALTSPSLLENCKSVHIYTVEALADASDEVIHRLGMGGRALQQRATDWLSEKAGNATKLVAELDALRRKSESQQERIRELEAALKDQDNGKPDAS